MDRKRQVAITSVAAAVLLTGAKLTVGLLTGSLGILSEAAHSGLDLLAAGMTWWAVSLSDRPADAEHPYGHEKIENLSALFETVLLLVTCVWIIYEAVERLFFRAPEVEVNAWSYAVVLGAIAVDFSRSRALSRVAKETRSAALEADALHFSSDIFSSLVVLVGLISTQLGYPQADAIAGLGVSVFVIWISLRLGGKAIGALTDRVPADHVARAERAALGVKGVRRVYDVRVRQAGAKHFVDLKVAVGGASSLARAHEVTEAVERALHGAFKHADVLVHAEPDEESRAGILEEILHLAEEAGTAVHAIQVEKTRDGLDVEMHFEFAADTGLADAHRQATRLEKDLTAAFPDIRHVQSHLECARGQSPERRDVTRQRPEVVEAVRRAALRVEGVRSCHNVRLLQAEGRLVATLDCGLDPRLRLRRAHELATEVERLVGALPEVSSASVHTEPSGRGGP